MSLALLEGYSSADEDGREESELLSTEDAVNNSSEEEDSIGPDGPRASYSTPYILSPPPVGLSSGLPSAVDAFSEVPGPPQFLNNSVQDNASTSEIDHSFAKNNRWKARKDKEFPTGVIVQAKAQLVGIQDRVRSDIESNNNSLSNTRQDEIKRIPTATNPEPGDAAELLRICLQCGVPKTFSSSKGIVCPICNDRAMGEAKKKGSMIKDKEKNKRMKGQSSHATWKSETEMHLRQQFD